MIYIRADMNSTIATGHIMRCLSIADAIRSLGDEVTFIIADNNPRELLESREYRYFVLDTKWDELNTEIESMVNLIKKEHIKTLLVDHYSITKEYLENLRQYTYVSYIDDMNSFIYPVDTVICYANYYKKFNYQERYNEIGLNTSFLTGIEYAPLRSVFCNRSRKTISKSIETVLVMSGGSDPYHFIKNVLMNIKGNGYNRIIALCGRYNPDYDKLTNQYEKCENIEVIKAVDNIEDYMEMADVVISAAGSTLYELCAMGTPTVSYTYADNQFDNAKQFDEDGIIHYAGDLRKDDVYKNINEILREMMDYEYRKNISMKMQKLVDGNGAFRIANELIHRGKGEQ